MKKPNDSRLLDLERDSRKYLQSIIDDVPVGIAIVDGNKMSFRWTNKTYRDLLNVPYDSQGIMGVNVARVIPDFDATDIGKLFRKTATTRKMSRVNNFEYNGSPRGTAYWQFSLIPVLEPQDSKDFMMVVTDTTAEVRARKKIERLAAELAKSNSDLENFAHIASHDMHQPLRAISGYIELLEEEYFEKLDRNGVHYIERAKSATGRMQELIDNLMHYASLRKIGSPHAPTDFDVVLVKAKENLSVMISETKAVVEHDPLPTLVADETQIVELFQNLIGNAIKFHGSHPPLIHISAERKGDTWVFSVKDNGIGIAKKDLKRIFEMFEQVSKNGHYPGIGIGLAVCARVLERHGGRIWAESEVGKGSTFYFSLPVNGTKRRISTRS